MQTWVINLDRNPDRREEFARRNAGITTVTRFAAIDGQTLDRADLIARGVIDPALTTYTPGAFGCALSHAALWQHCIALGQPITVCEDDAVLHGQFAALSDAAVGQLGGDFDLVMWGWNFDSWLAIDLLPGVSPALVTFDQGRMRAALDVYQRTPVQPQLLPLLRSFGTPCYTISPRGATNLLRASFPLTPFEVFFPGLNRSIPNNGIDMPMNRCYPSLRALAAFPPLALTTNFRERSTIQR